MNGLLASPMPNTSNKMNERESRTADDNGPGDMEGSIGFCLGLAGMTVCDALIRWARRWRDGPSPIFSPPPRDASPR
jgi:hypothetical protein